MGHFMRGEGTIYKEGAPGVRKCGQVVLLWPTPVRSIPCSHAEIVDLAELPSKLISRGSPVQFGAPPPCFPGVTRYPPSGPHLIVLILCHFLAAVDQAPRPLRANSRADGARTAAPSRSFSSGPASGPYRHRPPLRSAGWQRCAGGHGSGTA
jgi:hypothetical protein